MNHSEVVIRQWLQYIRLHRSEATTELYCKVMRRFRPFMPPYFEELSWRQVDDWKDQLVTTGVKTNSVNTYINVLKSLCHWVSRQYDLDNPMRKVDYLPKAEISRRILSHEEVQLLLRAARGTEWEAIYFLARTGARTREFCCIAWKDFTPDYRHVVVRGKTKRGQQDRFRSVPISWGLREMLLKHKGEDPIPFVAAYNKHRRHLSHMLEAVSRRARIDPVATPHSLRHYFTTRMVEKGESLKKIAEILGHASTRTTETVYVHLTRPSVTGATDCLDEDD